LGFKIQGLGSWVLDLDFRVYSLGFRVQDSPDFSHRALSLPAARWCPPGASIDLPVAS